MPTRRRRRRPLRNRTRAHWLRRVLFSLLFLPLALLLLTLLLLRWVNPPWSMYMLSQGIHTEGGASLRQQWQSVHTLPPHVPLAVIAAEDQLFPVHRGFDWRSIRDAVRQRREGGRLRGASTITQQTAKNLFLWHGRSFLRKTLEAGLTMALEGLWPKARVLEVYLNTAEWGPGVFGIEAAARHHYGLPARALNAQQAAALAAILPNPRAHSPTSPSPPVEQRIRWIEQQMRQLGPLWLAPLQLESLQTSPTAMPQPDPCGSALSAAASRTFRPDLREEPERARPPAIVFGSSRRHSAIQARERDPRLWIG